MELDVVSIVDVGGEVPSSQEPPTRQGEAEERHIPALWASKARTP